MIVILDYGLGNLASIKNMLNKIGYESKISSSEKEILDADRLILPGVGDFGKGMKNIKEKSLIPVLDYCAFEKKMPILGICLGMQLMTSYSEEGKCEGLGWIEASTIRFNLDKSYKIPHMGWNYVKFHNDHFSNPDDKTPKFYFVHSYHVVCNRKEDVLGTCNYGFDFHSAFIRENILGVQFHPEKSHSFGMKFLNQFMLLQK